jgi:hypothetical protein
MATTAAAAPAAAGAAAWVAAVAEAEAEEVGPLRPGSYDVLSPAGFADSGGGCVSSIPSSSSSRCATGRGLGGVPGAAEGTLDGADGRLGWARARVLCYGCQRCASFSPHGRVLVMVALAMLRLITNPPMQLA